MLPLWTGAIPVGMAYGAAAQDVGLSLAETLLMSMTVFSAATQMSAIALIGDGMPTAILVGTALALNIQLLLIGLSAGRQVRPCLSGCLVGAYFLTDAAYGVAWSDGKLTFARLVGAGMSMFVAWNLGTMLGATATGVLPIPEAFPMDFVVPLTFLAVLVPLVQTWAAALTVFVTGVAMLGLMPLLPNGIAVLTAILVGSAAGGWWAYRAPMRRAREMQEATEGPQ